MIWTLQDCPFRIKKFRHIHSIYIWLLWVHLSSIFFIKFLINYNNHLQKPLKHFFQALKLFNLYLFHISTKRVCSPNIFIHSILIWYDVHVCLFLNLEPWLFQEIYMWLPLFLSKVNRKQTNHWNIFTRTHVLQKYYDLFMSVFIFTFEYLITYWSKMRM